MRRPCRKELGEVPERAQRLANSLRGLWDRLRGAKGGPEGMHQRLEVGFESFSSHYERLQKSFADPNRKTREESQQDTLDEIRNVAQKIWLLMMGHTPEPFIR